MWHGETWKRCREEPRKEVQQGVDELDRGEGTPWNKVAFLEEARSRLNAKKEQQAP